MQLQDAISYLVEYRYWLIVPLAIVEGPILMVLCGFLLKLGIFSFLPVYGLLMLGDLIGDIVWYKIGFHWGRPFLNKFGKYFSVSEESIFKIEALFHKYQRRILFISKITMGFGFALATLIAAGMAKIRFRDYLVFNSLGQLVWTGLLMTIGFLFGNLYIAIDEGLRNFALLIFAIVTFALITGFGKYIRALTLSKKI